MISEKFGSAERFGDLIRHPQHEFTVVDRTI
jgi:hypothetical protein